MSRAAVRRGGNWCGLGGNQVCGDRDRPHARPAAAMRDAEGLVQVDVADIGADQRRGFARPASAFMFAPSM